MWWPARRAFAALLKRRGPAPRHVALIMDGNRRYADAAGLSGPLAGHESGYAKMVDAIKWLFELGVGTVSVYAFSLDNFRRDAAEVAGLMALAADKFDALVADGDAERAWGAEVRVLGDVARAPPTVRTAAARLMRASAAAATAAEQEKGGASGPRRVVNVCFAYTSSEELKAALNRVRGGLAGCQLLPSDVTPALLLAALHTGAPPGGAKGAGLSAGAGALGAGGGCGGGDCGGGSPPVDLLLRTSGEERLSDFLVWQARGALLAWLPPLWPQLTFLDVARAVRDWQDAAPALAALAAAADASCARACSSSYGGGGDAPVNGSGGGGGGGGGSGGGGYGSVEAWAASLGMAWLVGGGDSGGGAGGAAGGSDAGNSSVHGISGGSSLYGDGGGSDGAPAAAAAAPPGALASLASLERAASSALSMISEDEAGCAPHPLPAQRVGSFLEAVAARRHAWVDAALLDDGKAGAGGAAALAAAPA